MSARIFLIEMKFEVDIYVIVPNAFR